MIPGSGIRPPPGEGNLSCPGLEGQSPMGEEGDSELKELEVDMAVGTLFFIREGSVPFLLPNIVNQ